MDVSRATVRNRATLIDIPLRDVDVPLSALGERQAAALGRWFAALPPNERPTVMLSSSYVRARRTAAILRESAGINPGRVPLVVDERNRFVHPEGVSPCTHKDR